MNGTAGGKDPQHCLAIVWRSLNPLNNSAFSAGKPAIPSEAHRPQAEASAIQNPGKIKASGYPLA
jgi:hypothetical protein